MSLSEPPRYPFVRVPVVAADVHDISAELFELGASGVEERDDTAMDRAGEGVELIAHFPDEPLARAAIEALAPRLVGELDFIVGDDWRDRWKEFFKPARVGERFLVRPPWEPVEPRDGDRVITIDPGQAFGTGTHETTRLVMREVERIACAGEVLDVGCGSGILGIAARLCGATRVVGVDVDPIAARTTLENADVNGVSIEASTTDVADVPGTFDLVLANIRRPILVPMADALKARCRGHLVLSGLLVEERDEVRACFDARFTFDREGIDGDWLSLTYRALGKDR